jgi:hypothetical protein
MEIARGTGDVLLDADALARLALVAAEGAGKRDEAEALTARALEVYAESGSRGAQGALLGRLAELHVASGDFDEARLDFGRALCILRACGARREEGVVLVGLAALEAHEGAIDAARGALHRAAECLRGRVRDLALVEIARGHVEIALARQARRAGEEARAAMYVEAAQHRQEDAARSGASSAALRLGVASLARVIEGYVRGEEAPASRRAGAIEIPEGALAVCARGRWFRTPGGAKVEIERWQALQNLVVRLAEQREIAPGQPLSVEQLVSAGWPGERMLAKSGATRVYTALSTLRRLGLRDLIVRDAAGYMLKPGVPLVRVSARD